MPGPFEMANREALYRGIIQGRAAAEVMFAEQQALIDTETCHGFLGHTPLVFAATHVRTWRCWFHRCRSV